MEHALFIGGFKHGALEAILDTSSPKLYYQFPAPNKVTWYLPGPNEYIEDFYTIEYKHEGIWNGHYGYVHVYIESTSKYVSMILPGVMAQSLASLGTEHFFILETNPVKDEYATLVKLETAKMLAAKFGQPVLPHGFIIPDGEFVPPNLWTPVTYKKYEDPLPSKKPVTIAGISEMLKQAYADQIQAQMVAPSWVYESLSMEKSRPLAKHEAWLNAGMRDAKRTQLCYECAKEIVGFDFAIVNDLKVPKGKGKRVRKLVCGNCGRGKFNRRGQRIGDWPKGEASGPL